MSRTIDAQGLVTLPRMDAQETLALVASLAAAAKKNKKDLPGGVARQLKELKDAAKRLGEATAAADSPTP